MVFFAVGAADGPESLSSELQEMAKNGMSNKTRFLFMSVGLIVW
jgi:hypothetical protein